MKREKNFAKSYHSLVIFNDPLQIGQLFIEHGHSFATRSIWGNGMKMDQEQSRKGVTKLTKTVQEIGNLLDAARYDFNVLSIAPILLDDAILLFVANWFHSLTQTLGCLGQ